MTPLTIWNFDMTELWKPRRPRRNWKAIVVFVAAALLLGSMCALSFNAEAAFAAGKPPVNMTKPYPPRWLQNRYACTYQYPKWNQPTYCK